MVVAAAPEEVALGGTTGTEAVPEGAVPVVEGLGTAGAVVLLPPAPGVTETQRGWPTSKLRQSVRSLSFHLRRSAKVQPLAAAKASHPVSVANIQDQEGNDFSCQFELACFFIYIYIFMFVKRTWREGDLRRTTTCLVQLLIGMGTTAMAWEAARARTATERVNFMVIESSVF